MNDILSVVYDLLSDIFFLFILIFYYLSIRKCFFKREKGKVKFFLLTMLFNPLTIYFTNFLIESVFSRVARSLLNIESSANAAYTVFYLITMPINNLVYLALIFLFSRLYGKWLEAHNISLVTFVNVMYCIIVSASIKSTAVISESTSDEEVLLLGLFRVVGVLPLIGACFLMYFFIISALSKLTDRKRTIDPKLFIVPPAIYFLIYNASPMIIGLYTDNLGKLLIDLLSTAILFLFIWAFYVIIKNINATNEAIEAKDLAAEMARNEALREADLNIAKNIQSSALPSEFPPFPEHKEFELFASMNAAKEVGGDFYDFYMINDSTLGFLIADVSGKSIPGAMFMMTSKTVVKSLAESGMPPAEVFTRANEKLCEGNDAEMFVTAWLGYLDLKTGIVRVANAGHNPPVLIHDGKAEYVILKPGLMLAGMDGVRYKEQTVKLEKGDMLYLYTDGVTEAMDKDEEQYGEERLQKLLSFGENCPAPSEENGIVEPVCEAVIADVRRFTNGAEQSDDITMLCVRYLGGRSDEGTDC